MRGSIKKLGKNKWQLVYDVPPTEGLKRKQKKEVFNGTKAEAEARLADVVAQVKTGTYITDTGMTVGDYLLYWYERHKDRVRYKTSKSYKGTIEVHLVPGIGSYKLIELKPTHIQDYYASKKHLSNTTVLYHHRVLSMALKQAVKWEMIARNPADGAIPPEKDKYDGVRLSPEEVQYILENTEGSILHIPIALAAFLGARRGEICALSWDDVDFGMKAVAIRRSLGRVDGKMEPGPTKTNKERAVAMGNYLSDLLQKHKAKQQTWNEAAGIDRDYVCCWEDGRPLDPDYVSRGYKKVLDDLGLNTDSRFHDLRHNFATLSLKAKVNPKIVSEMLGHTTTSHLNFETTTNKVYSHVDIEMQREVAKLLELEYTKNRKPKRKGQGKIVAIK